MIMDKYDILKNACNAQARVYLLVDRVTFEILRMAWGDNLSDAEAYFKAWIESEKNVYLHTPIDYEDCFVTEVMKETIK